MRKRWGGLGVVLVVIGVLAAQSVWHICVPKSPVKRGLERKGTVTDRTALPSDSM